MNILSAENLSKSYNERFLFQNLTIGLNMGEKAALVGVNGCGKSTLLKILAGVVTPDVGKVSVNNSIKVVFLDQNTPYTETNTIWQEVFDSANPLAKAILDYDESLESGDTDKMTDAIEQLDLLNGWDFESKIKQILGKLGLHDPKLQMGKLSGGQKKRVSIAKVLLQEPDLLILDEPTNHLDLDAIEWLEEYLSTANMSLLLVTHDRYFLDRITNVIFEIDRGELFKYNGNYSYFLEKKAEREMLMQTEVEKAKNLFSKELDWMRRQPKARTTKAKYRVDAFEDVKAKAHVNLQKDALELNIISQRQGKKVLEVKGLNKAYGDKVILKDFEYTFIKQDRIGIVGENGAGKSTFLNILTGKIQADSGEIDKGLTTKFGYYEQTELKTNENVRVIDFVKEVAEVIEYGNGNVITASQLLTKFLFSGDAQYQPIYKLSGGEKRRLQLLRVLIANPNFLILDEPTNDLDIITLNLLEDFLERFDGCLIIVSHDRFFMDKLVNHIFAFEENGKIKDFHGNYGQYRDYKEQMELHEAEKKKNPAPVQKVEKTEVKRKLNFKEQKEYEDLEKQIATLEAKKEALVTELNSGITDYDALKNLSDQIKNIDDDIEAKTFRWIELSEWAN